jgi:hypothetical protein
MKREILIKITNELYRLTLLFPKKEPLRYKMRELADDILADFLRMRSFYEYTNKNSSAKNNSRLLENLEILDSLFEVAKEQNWVAAVELLRVQEEYNKIKAEIEKIAKPSSEPTEIYIGQTPVKVTEVRPLQNSMNERQQKILEFLREKEKVQVWQIKQIFPEISKRTLRRDFKFLLKEGKIERIGQRNETFYRLLG